MILLLSRYCLGHRKDTVDPYRENKIKGQTFNENSIALNHDLNHQLLLKHFPQPGKTQLFFPHKGLTILLSIII